MFRAFAFIQKTLTWFMRLCSVIFSNHRKSVAFIDPKTEAKTGNVFCLPMPMPVRLTCVWIQTMQEYFMPRLGAFIACLIVWKAGERVLLFGKVAMVAIRGKIFPRMKEC